mmetsp:Transcript_44941/g.119144  ORF Transcript_44941/g.119144 Transcript_44941/m.119144 type:complete len:254 (-) Transcript_44941:174-935(-)
MQCVMMALNWFQSWGQWRCNSMLHFSSSSANSLSWDPASWEQPSLSSAMDTPTRVSQASPDFSRIRCVRLKLFLSFSKARSALADASMTGKRCGIRRRMSSKCFSGAARKVSMRSLGKTKKNSGSHDSHIEANAGEDTRTTRKWSTKLSTAFRTRTSTRKRLPVSQLLRRLSSRSTKPGLLHSVGSTVSKQKYTSCMKRRTEQNAARTPSANILLALLVSVCSASATVCSAASKTSKLNSPWRLPHALTAALS